MFSFISLYTYRRIRTILLISAANECINGYLETILHGWTAAIEENEPIPVNVMEMGHFNPTKYFVEDMATGLDETILTGH